MWSQGRMRLCGEDKRQSCSTLSVSHFCSCYLFLHVFQINIEKSRADVCVQVQGRPTCGCLRAYSAR